MTVTVGNESISAGFDEQTGQIVSIRNTTRDLDLVASADPAPAFRIRRLDGSWRAAAASDSFVADRAADGLRLTWTGDDGLVVRASVRVDGNALAFGVAVSGLPDAEAVEYPLVANVGRLSGAGSDKLLHSHGAGVLFDDPLDLFDEDEGPDERCMRYSPYPDGFHGSTLQMLAYYGQGAGGFVVHTSDADRATKWFSVRKSDGALTIATIHQVQVYADGLVPYETVVTPMVKGTWPEAADIYRRWARANEWAQPRAARSDWLRNEVGLATFGVNASHDRSAWFDYFHQLAGTPVFHILGANWPRYGQDYHNNHPRGRSDWFPARFSAENLDMIAKNGDYWAPFEFDLQADLGGDEHAEVENGRMVQYTNSLRPLAIVRPHMCAGTEYFRELHRWRDTTLVEEYGVDALYYDISVSNLLLHCDATTHDHEPGGGLDVAARFHQMYRATLASASAAKGQHVPMGTEVINEAVLDLFDYYQARAQSTPLGPFELDYFRDWIVAGKAEHVPLLKYVYGPAAPLAIDGWSNLAVETGELTYWVAAKVLVNGGLLELNYEFSGLEDLDGHVDDPSEHYWDYPQRGFKVDAERAEFFGRIARARVGKANAWLADGEMLPGPVIEAPTVELDYFRYNTFRDGGYEERGAMSVPAVVGSAWELNGKVLWLLANVTAEPVTVLADGEQLTVPARDILVVER